MRARAGGAGRTGRETGNLETWRGCGESESLSQWTTASPRATIARKGRFNCRYTCVSSHLWKWPVVCWARRWRWLCSPALCSVCRKERGNIGDKLRNTRCHPYLKVCGPRCVCFCFDSIRFDSLELAAYCCFYARKWLIKCWKMCTTLFLLCVNVICCWES